SYPTIRARTLLSADAEYTILGESAVPVPPSAVVETMLLSRIPLGLTTAPIASAPALLSRSIPTLNSKLLTAPPLLPALNVNESALVWVITVYPPVAFMNPTITGSLGDGSVPARVLRE